MVSREKFSPGHYENVLKSFAPDVQNQCRVVTFGDVFSNDPNGSILATEFGPIITISQALWHFLFFGHLALNCDKVAPVHVRLAALRIAVRIMLRTETMDFSLDPRGKIPGRLNVVLKRSVATQLQFIAGHEFAHHILGHLSQANVMQLPLLSAPVRGEKESTPIPIYNQSQKEEFEADLQSILLPDYDVRRRVEVLEGALLFFACLELYETVREIISPSSPLKIKTHPGAIERYENLLMNVPLLEGERLGTYRKLSGVIDFFKEFLRQDVALRPETYETYGSVYLDMPNSKWRGPKLIDRQDY